MAEDSRDEEGAGEGVDCVPAGDEELDCVA
jgi:hypothetical protein